MFRATAFCDRNWLLSARSIMLWSPAPVISRAAFCDAAGFLFEGRWMRGLAADPYLAAFEMLFFPNRYDFLQPIDREPARLERFCAMRRRDRKRHRRLAYFDDADAMRDRDAHDFPSRASLYGELAHLG